MIEGFYRIFGVNSHLNKFLRILFSRSQPVQKDIRTTAPTSDTLKNNEMAWYDDGTNQRLYVNLNGTIRYVDLI